MKRTPRPSPTESDFSARKMRIALVALVGSVFGSSILPYAALMFALLPMTREFGWSRTEFSWATTALMWTGSCTIPFMGRAADRLGVRPVILGGTAAVGLITLAVAHVGRNPWPFWILFALLGAFGCSGVAYTKVTAALFTRHRGKALAIFGAESAVAAAFAPLLTNYLVQNFGWRGMFTGYGLIILAVVPIVFFFLPEPDAEPGASAWRRRPRPSPGAAAPPRPFANAEGMTAGEALKDRAFWILVVASICAMAPGAGVMNHLIAAVVGKGFSQTVAANVATFAMLLGVGWTLLGGYLVDRVPTAKINVPFQLLTALGFILFSVVTPAFGGLAVLLIAYSLQGLGITAGRAMGTYFQSRFFGLKNFGEITAIQSAPLSLSMGLTAPLMGWIYDTTHSYQLAFVICIVGLLIAAALFMLLGRYRYSATGPGPGAIEEFVQAVAVAKPSGAPLVASGSSIA